MGGGGAAVEGGDGVEDVEGLVVVGAGGAAGAEGVGEVAQAEAAAIFGIAIHQGDFANLLILGAVELHGAAEGIGVGHEEGALAAVDLEARLVGVVGVEGGEQGADGAGGIFDGAGDVGIHVHVDGRAV